MPRTPSEVLTPSAGMRAAFALVAALFDAALLWTVREVATGSLEWTTTNMIGVPAVVLIALATTLGAVAAWTNRVWVDHERNELRQHVVLRDVVRTLDPPGQVELRHRPAAPGSTVSPTWQVVQTQPGLPPMTVGTPWVRDITDVLRILQPALERNPDLAADDYTRRSIQAPEELARPTRR